jgi:hypothetical protein
MKTEDEKIFADWKDIPKRLDEIKKWRVDRFELFPYHAVENFTSELLSALEIPAEAYTRFVVYNQGAGAQPVQVGKGRLTRLDREKGHIESGNKVIFYKQQTEKEKKQGKGIEVLGKIGRTMWRDFKGNVIMQQEHNKSTTYMFNFNKYGVGGFSFTAAYDPLLKTYIVNSASIHTGRDDDSGMFSFLTLQGKFIIMADGKPVTLEPSVLANHNKLDGMKLGVSAQMVSNISLTLKDGQGRLKAVLSSYKGKDVTAEDIISLIGKFNAAIVNKSGYKGIIDMRAIAREFDDITFIEQTGEIIDAYDAGAFHLGYGKNGFTYRVGQTFKNVLDRQAYEEKYGKNGYISKANGLKIIRTGGTDEQSEIRFVYTIDERRKAEATRKEEALDPTGRIDWEIHRGKIFVNPTMKLMYDHVYGFGKEAYQVGWLGLGWGGSLTKISDNALVYDPSQLGHWWVFDARNEEGSSFFGQRWDEFVNGRQFLIRVKGT